MVDGMVIEMRRHRIRRHIVGRMLHRRKGINGLAQRQYNNTARVLARGPADTGTALHDPVDLTVPLAGAALFIVFFYIAKCCLVCQRTDGSRTEGLTCTEDNLRIFVCLGLIITGDVQVDIRLLVSLESKEGLEGNIKSVFS